MERVADLESQLARLKVTHGARIDDLDAHQFSFASDKARHTHRTLVAAAARAAREARGSGERPTRQHCIAIADECLVALANDLMLSTSSTSFMGVDVPSQFTLDLDAPPESWHEHAFGLLMYRLWQLVVRTPAVRAR